MPEQTVTILAKLIDSVSKPADQVRSKLFGIKDAVGKLKDSLSPLTGRASALIGGLLSAATISRSLNEANEASDARQRLVSALDQDVKQVEKFVAQAEKAQDLTTTSTTEGIRIIANLKERGVAVRDLTETFETSLDTAAALNNSVEATAEQIARTFSGVVSRELKIAVPELDNLTEAELRAGRAVEILNQKFRGRAAALAQSDVGRQIQNNNKINDQFERLGTIIQRIQGRILPALNTGLERLVNIIERRSDNPLLNGLVTAIEWVLQHLPEVVGGFVALQVGVRVLPPLFTILGVSAKALFTVLLAIFSPTGAIIAGGVLLTGVFLEIIKKLTGAKVGVLDLAETISDLWAKVREGSISFSGIVSQVVIDFKAIWEYIKLYIYDLPVAIVDNLITQLGNKFARLGAEVNLRLSQALALLPERLGGVSAAVVAEAQLALDKLRQIEAETPGVGATIETTITEGVERIERTRTEEIAELTNAEQFNQRQREVTEREARTKETVEKESTEDPTSKINQDVENERRRQREIATLRDQQREIEKGKIVGFNEQVSELELKELESLYAAKKITLERYLDEKDRLERKSLDDQLKGLRETLAEEQKAEEEARKTDANSVAVKDSIQKQNELLSQINLKERERAALLTDQANRRTQLTNETVRELSEFNRSLLERRADATESDELRAQLKLQETKLKFEQEIVAAREAGRSQAEIDRLIQVQQLQLARQRQEAERAIIDVQLERAEKVREAYERQIRINNDLAQAGSITPLEAQQRNAIALRKFEEQVAQTEVRIRGQLAEGLLSEKDTQEVLDRLQQIRDAVPRVVIEAQKSGQELRASLQSPLESFLFDLQTSAKSIREIFADLFQSIGNEMLRLINRRLAERLLNAIGGGGFQTDQELGGASASAGVFTPLGAGLSGTTTDNSAERARAEEAAKTSAVAEGVQQRAALHQSEADAVASTQQSNVAAVETAEATSTATTQTESTTRQTQRTTEADSVSAAEVNKSTSTVVAEQQSTVATQQGTAQRSSMYSSEASAKQTSDTIKTTSHTSAEDVQTTKTIEGAQTRTSANAAEAASGAAKSQAGIPIVGPILAAVAMAATLTLVLGLMSRIVRRNKGGVIPGGGADEDTVPAMLTPGEFVHRRTAVNHYGVGVMQAINNRLIPRDVLSPYTVASQVASSTSVPKKFATGGVVSESASMRRQSPVIPAIPADPVALEQLLAGGETAMLAWLESNREKVRGRIGVNS